MRIDPLRTGFYYVEYTYCGKKQNAVYFQLESAQEAMIKMIQRGVECHGLHEWKPKLEVLSLHKQK